MNYPLPQDTGNENPEHIPDPDPVPPTPTPERASIDGALRRIGSIADAMLPAVLPSGLTFAGAIDKALTGDSAIIDALHGALDLVEQDEGHTEGHERA